MLAEKFSAAREKRNSAKNIVGRYFSGRLAAERGKREQSEGKTEAAQKIAERDFLSFDFPDIRAFEA